MTKIDWHKNDDTLVLPAGQWVGKTGIRALLTSEEATDVNPDTFHGLFAVHELPEDETQRDGRLADDSLDGLAAESAGFIPSCWSRR